jgi:endonuclease/exonuclease/phosphatase family metal-dependent hydrolase
MRRLAALLVALALLAPTRAAADEQPTAPTLVASHDRVSPGATLELTVTAETAILGGTWKVKDADGKWRRLERWDDPDAHTGTVTKQVTALEQPGTRYFKVRTRFQDGSAVSNRVAVRTVTGPTNPGSPSGPPEDPADPGDPGNPGNPGNNGGNGNNGGGDFKAVTWNVYYGTPVAKLRPILRRLLRDGVSIFLMQEMSNPQARRMLEAQGLEVHYVAYQWVVAWDPAVWTARNTWGRRLSPTSFVRADGRGPIFVDSALATLEDRAGRSLDVMSYHLPPNVQARNPQPERLRIHRQSAATWRELVDTSTSDAMLFGGDDNLDEKNGYRSGTKFWDFMLRPATGLRQVLAPTGTIGRSKRRIDDFRIRGLKPGQGWTGAGGGDHKFFASSFSWR